MPEEEYSVDLDVLRHSASHVLAQAVTRLFPEAKLAIGPSIDTGFYYDFEVPEFFTQEDLKTIADEMKKIVKSRYRIERFELPRSEALELMKDQPYKIELIGALPEGETISFYKQGDFVDLCAGPHVDHTGRVKAFALLSTAGAYWRGDSAKAMLCRVYGTAFDNRESLDRYLKQMEEAKKRDHNKLGRELEYFTTSQVIGQGLPILLPNGAKVIQILERFVEDEEEKRGYLLTKTPFMAKSDLYKISGHWQHYRDGMFVIGQEDVDDNSEVLALRPMTCPFQFQAYLSRARSYRDLPLRYNETSKLFRNESSGEMHGLIRVRQFTISEGHLLVRPDQLEEEFKGCLELAIFMLKAVGLFEDVSYQFSKWDENKKEKYIGDKEQWENVQDRMRAILDSIDIDYVEAEGEAAFYGPKLDLQIKNVFGKEDTLITIQIDFLLAQQFNLVYTDFDGKKKHPYVIHRTSIGCYERTLALLIEKYAGALPLWISPEQIRILPITDRINEYAQSLALKLKDNGLRVTVDDRNEKIGYKIREAQTQKIPYMLVVGDDELKANTLAVRSRKTGDLGTMTFDDFLRKCLTEVKERNLTV
ncbi:MAG: threonine--tRNA ligase [Deltaproteobacteria bacterium]|jgi:threonyl-tRNA synthetase|nr:threonine--tRNA ligase [Deltaproteobacteria bacterium]